MQLWRHQGILVIGLQNIAGVLLGKLLQIPTSSRIKNPGNRWLQRSGCFLPGTPPLLHQPRPQDPRASGHHDRCYEDLHHRAWSRATTNAINPSNCTEPVRYACLSYATRHSNQYGDRQDSFNILPIFITKRNKANDRCVAMLNARGRNQQLTSVTIGPALSKTGRSLDAHSILVKGWQLFR